MKNLQLFYSAMTMHQTLLSIQLDKEGKVMTASRVILACSSLTNDVRQGTTSDDLTNGALAIFDLDIVGVCNGKGGWRILGVYVG